jgi:hypothetical protein
VLVGDRRSVGRKAKGERMGDCSSGEREADECNVFCSCHLVLSSAGDLLVPSLTSRISFITDYHLFLFEVSESPGESV